ncbi:MAG TPA: DUF4157 domain-containing protein, partial [Pyrinomonadaceae bacterium]|nr:DUF4157 domain-containing protein [Pyrinomonadaceae bacterium]
MATFARNQNQAQQKSSSNLTSSNRSTPATSYKARPLLHLQRMIGNQAVRGLLRARDDGAGADPKKDGLTSASPPIQTNLVVNTVRDVYEHEADQLAEQVMRMPEPEVQDACACSGGCAKCQPEQARQEPRLQTKHVGPGATGQIAAPSIVREVVASPGQPLSSSTRAFFEPRFGRDFSGVRVHTDAIAVQSAAAVNARAYTVGRDLVFARGQYAPNTATGQRLLAH